jgi:predicted protein tyrosine phosphatase
MEIYVLSREMARKRVPEKPELMIGLLDSFPYANTPVEPVPSRLRLEYLTYVFDDLDWCDEDEGKYIRINEEIAGKIIDDFSKFRERIESLAVHCRAGLSRSPAIAAALNVCFNLGISRDRFFGGGYMTNRLVYQTVIRAGIKKGLQISGDVF